MFAVQLKLNFNIESTDVIGSISYIASLVVTGEIDKEKFDKVKNHPRFSPTVVTFALRKLSSDHKMNIENFKFNSAELIKSEKFPDFVRSWLPKKPVEVEKIFLLPSEAPMMSFSPIQSENEDYPSDEISEENQKSRDKNNDEINQGNNDKSINNNNNNNILNNRIITDQETQIQPDLTKRHPFPIRFSFPKEKSDETIMDSEICSDSQEFSFETEDQQKKNRSYSEQERIAYTKAYLEELKNKAQNESKLDIQRRLNLKFYGQSDYPNTSSVRNWVNRYQPGQRIRNKEKE